MAMHLYDIEGVGPYDPELAKRVGAMFVDSLTTGQQLSIRKRGYAILTDPTGGYDEEGNDLTETGEASPQQD